MYSRQEREREELEKVEKMKEKPFYTHPKIIDLQNEKKSLSLPFSSLCDFIKREVLHEYFLTTFTGFFLFTSTLDGCESQF
jgi:hypothetical protein